MSILVAFEHWRLKLALKFARADMERLWQPVF